jgi:hypothetical protein
MFKLPTLRAPIQGAVTSDAPVLKSHNLIQTYTSEENKIERYDSNRQALSIEPFELLFRHVPQTKHMGHNSDDAGFAVFSAFNEASKNAKYQFVGVSTTEWRQMHGDNPVSLLLKGICPIRYNNPNGKCAPVPGDIILALPPRTGKDYSNGDDQRLLAHTITWREFMMTQHADIDVGTMSSSQADLITALFGKCGSVDPTKDMDEIAGKEVKNAERLILADASSAVGASEDEALVSVHTKGLLSEKSLEYFNGLAHQGKPVYLQGGKVRKEGMFDEKVWGVFMGILEHFSRRLPSYGHGVDTAEVRNQIARVCTYLYAVIMKLEGAQLKEDVTKLKLILTVHSISSLAIEYASKQWLDRLRSLRIGTVVHGIASGSDEFTLLLD